MPGFSNVRGDESIMYADNVSFDTTERGGKVTTDGQVLIGATAAPHIRVNTLTPGTGISITNGPGSITIATAGAALLQTTEDTGTAIPSAGNLNLLGQQAGTIPVMATNGSGATARFEDRTWTTPFVVDASSTVGLRGTYTTITAALTDAVSGQTIYIRPGTYTENLTLKAGVNLVAWLGSEYTPTVTIIGTLTATFAGTCTISGIRLQTNGATFLTVSGSAATRVILELCYLNATNNNGISMTSSDSGAEIMINYSRGELGTTGIAMWTSSSAGVITSYFCRYGNGGNSTTQSTNSAGIVNFFQTDCNFTVASSSTGSLGCFHSNMDVRGLNVTPVTYGGSGNSRAVQSGFYSGSASAISISAGATLNAGSISVQSTNANPVTGAGTIQYSGISGMDTGTGLNVTTQTAYTMQLGQYQAKGQPAFAAYLAASLTNATGDGTGVTNLATTEIFDQNNDYNTGNSTFTAPTTNRYFFQAGCLMGNIGAQTSTTYTLSTSNRSCDLVRCNPGNCKDSNNALTLNGAVLIDMDAADVAQFQVIASNSTKTVTITGGSSMSTYFTGGRQC